MEGLTQIMPLNGAMNQDDDHRYVRSSDGQVIERVNLRPNSIDGKRFINEKIKGNTLINIVLPSGDNKCIGWCNDFENSAIIAFIYNSNYLHSILRYFQKTKTIQKVWYGQTNLGFEDTNVRAFIADGMLYWVNGNQAPKSFVIDYAVRFTNSLPGDKYNMSFFPFSDVIFPMIKRPPQFAPTCFYDDMKFDWDTGNPITFNNLRRKMFQFKYRYVYLDNQQSAWSPISKVPLPPREVSVIGEWDTDVCVNNSIFVTINTGNAYVKRIDLAVRQCYDRSAVGDFYLFKEIDKYDKSFTKLRPDFDIEAFPFLNTSVLENINTTINNRYCDDVPLSGNDTLLLDGKYCAISMPVKNYDLVDVDYDLEAVEDEVDENALVPANLPYTYNSGSHLYTIAITYYANTDYWIVFTDHAGTGHSYTINSSTIAFPSDNLLASTFAAQIQADGANIANFDSCTSNGNDILLNFNTAQPTNFQAFYYINGSEGQLVYKSLKRSQYHPFVIIYNDGFGRYGIAQGDKELFSPSETDCVNIFTVKCKMSINSLPPSWAVSYRIGYLPNHSYLYFIQAIGVPVWKGDSTGLKNAAGVYYTESTDNIRVIDVPDDCYFIPVNNAIRNMREENPNTFIADYIYTEGDRIRKPCSANTYEILREVTVNYWWHGDNPTTDDPRGTITGILTKTNLADVGHAYAHILEIYRPNPSIQVSTASYNNVFYETGDEYEILNPGEVNARHGITQYGATVHPITDVAQVLDAFNQPLTPAELTLDFGDVYVRGRMGYTPTNPMVPYPALIEDIHYTDFFTSSGIDMGRVTAKIESEQKTLNSIVRGEQFLENTETNWLNVFILGTKSFDASDLYGPITGIEEMGGTLKVIQEHKEGSITIGEVTAKFADVGEFTYIGDTVFGAYRRYPENRGTTYRRSMAQNNRYLYYFDESTGEYIRSSPNGQAPISKEYNMQNWFEKKAKELREFVGDKDVVTSFDNDYEEVLVSFVIGDEIETIVFSEKEGYKGWMEYRTYFNDTDIPELFASFKDTLVSWMNGKLYLHNTGANNTFYGKLHACSLKVPVNGHVQYTKRYSSIRLSSDKNIWYAELTIPEGENYIDQKTLLLPAMFREKENALYSDILRNIISRAGIEDFTLIYNGTRMVGEYMDVEFTDATNEDVSLGAVQVNYQIAK